MRFRLLLPLYVMMVTTGGGYPEAVMAQADVEPRVAITGFVSGTVFAQDQLFAPGNGQNAQYIESPDAAPRRWWHGGDARNTRLAVELTQHDAVLGWDAAAIVETDFFGGFQGEGAFVPEQPLPRLRLAYAEVSRGGTTLRLGQDWSPIYGFVPESVTHVAFPLGWGSAGLIGWRFPGLFFEQEFPAWGDTEGRVHVAALRGAWDDADDPEAPSAGQNHLIPQVQVRLDLGRDGAGGIDWELFVAGHVDRKTLARHAQEAETLTGLGATAGFRVRPSPVTLLGTGYVGRALGQHAAHISQFGDLRGWGAFLQAGVALTDRWSAWVFGGHDTVAEHDLAPGDRSANTSVSTMLRFEAGPIELGASWLHTRTSFLQAALPERTIRPGNQIALSTLFHF